MHLTLLAFAPEPCLLSLLASVLPPPCCQSCTFCEYFQEARLAFRPSSSNLPDPMAFCRVSLLSFSYRAALGLLLVFVCLGFCLLSGVAYVFASQVSWRSGTIVQLSRILCLSLKSGQTCFRGMNCTRTFRLAVVLLSSQKVQANC